MPKVVLYGASTSSCTWRVRIALKIKGIDFTYVEDMKSAGFLRASPMRQVPVLVVDDKAIIQSIAILEYLEELQPSPPLLPRDPILRAKVRGLSEAVVSGIQPFQATSDDVIREVGGPDRFQEWAKFWIHKGFHAIEVLLEETGGQFCAGDDVTMADLCLVPQYNNARHRYKMDLSKYPRICRVCENCLKLESFENIKS